MICLVIMNAKLLLIGNKGQLGREIEDLAAKKKFNLTGLDLPEFDISSEDSIQDNIVNKDYDLIINASAYTAVDKAESDQEVAFRVNSQGPERLAEICSEKKIPFIHISTDYVFDGTKNEPYREDDPVNPLNVYGKSKLEAENHIRTILEKHIIIRTAWLYGNRGQNFVKTMLRLAQEKEELSVVNDQFGCPTYAPDLAEAILTVAERVFTDSMQMHWGIYHFCGQGTTNWYEFAGEIFKAASHYTDLKIQKVIPVSSAEFPSKAVRPKNSSLNCSLIESRYGIRSLPWKESLKKMIRRHFTES